MTVMCTVTWSAAAAPTFTHTPPLAHHGSFRWSAVCVAACARGLCAHQPSALIGYHVWRSTKVTPHSGQPRASSFTHVDARGVEIHTQQNEDFNRRGWVKLIQDHGQRHNNNNDNNTFINLELCSSLLVNNTYNRIYLYKVCLHT